jgi:hypothetical protein
MTVRQLALTIFAVVLMGLPAEGQSTAELLQKGIYTQETVGDLDGAIKIYRQIVNSASQSRTYAAQAQYRLAQCLLKKGENAEAVKAFQKLMRDYPEEKELVAKAREYVPSETKYLPIPWEASELSEFHVKLQNGLNVATLIYSIEPAAGNPQNSIMLTRTYVGSLPTRQGRVEANRDTMRPVSSMFKNVMMSDYKFDYEGRRAHIRVGNKEPRILTFDAPVFDNEEALFLFRRLPLAVGYKTTLTVMSPGGIVVNLVLAVTAMEDVQVPAGKFHCFRVDLSNVNQTFWIAAEPSRPVVKFDAEVVAELVSIRKVDRHSPVNYQDARVGISFTAPPGWMVRPEEATAKDETPLSMLDPESKISLDILAKETRTAPSEITRELRATLDQRVERRSHNLKDYHVRPETVQIRQIAGNQALTCVTEFLRGEEEMVEYLTWVRSENTNLLFSASGPASDLDDFRKRIDPIVETARVK